MAGTSLFPAKACYPGLEDLPALDDSPILANCAVPAPLQPVTICPVPDLPPAVPAVDRALHISVVRGPVSGTYDWVEEVPDGNGGWAAGPRSGLISHSTWAVEANNIAVTPGPRVYPATLIGGTGKCVFIAGLTEVAYDSTAAGAVLYIQLTAYSASLGAYDWRQVVASGGGTGGGDTTWTETGTGGTAAGGDGAVDQNGLPAPADGTTIYKAARDSAGKLAFNALDAGQGVVALTGSGGIPAATDATHPSGATVDLYAVDKATGALVDAGVAATMYNIDPAAAVAGDSYVQGQFAPGLGLIHIRAAAPAGGYFGCILSADCPAGTPGAPATGQTIWQIKDGARSNVTTSGSIYNDTPNDVPSGAQVILASNSDGTYTVVGKVCA